MAEKDGQQVILLVEVTKENCSGQDLILSQPGVSSRLEVSSEPGTPDVMVGGLNDAAEQVKEENPSAAAVTLIMSVEGREEAAAEGAESIRELAGNKLLQYLDIQVEQDIDGVISPLSETPVMIESVIPFDFSQKTGIKVYRYHGEGSEAEAAELIPARNRADGTLARNEWVASGGEWYYLGEDGKWYFFNPVTAEMLTGWQAGSI